MTNNSEALINRIHEITALKGKPGLARMRRLLELLGNPEQNLKIFHVAGTNGKGSIVRYLTSMLGEAGYTTGVYTSPHVMEYNERFEVNGSYITDEEFCRFGEMVLAHSETLNEEGYGYPSEFEILTSIAYLFFCQKAPDYVMMEVGLGGVIDSTNTVEEPVACIIGQIGYDHVSILGNTLEEIAWNKAGIIKPGIPVISESPEPEVRKVIREEAARIGAPFIDTAEFSYDIAECRDEAWFDAEIMGREYRGVKLAMTGEHQVRNAIAAVSAVIAASESGKLEITENNIRDGLSKASVMGRFEILSREPYFIIDGAHNPSGVEASIKAFRTYFSDYINEVTGEFEGLNAVLVYGCFKDKPYQEMVAMLAEGLRGIHFVATEPISDRALEAETIAALLQSEGLDCEIIKDEREAYDGAVSGQYDVVFCIGSIYLIGDMRIMFQAKGWK